MRVNSSIDDITRTLDPVKRQRGLISVFHAGRNAAEIAGCAQELKQVVDGFLVGNVTDGSYFRNSLILLLFATDGDGSDGRGCGRGASRHITILVR